MGTHEGNTFLNTRIFTRESIRGIRFEYQDLYLGKHQGNTFSIQGSLPRKASGKYVLNTRIFTRESIRGIRFKYQDLYLGKHQGNTF